MLLWVAGQQAGLFALGWIALTPLLWATQGLSKSRRFRLGYLSGWIAYALCNWWIIPSIIKGGGLIGVGPVAGAALGLLAVSLVAIIHGFQFALVACFWDTEHPQFARLPWLLPLFASGVWTAFEFLRGQTPLAHSWGSLANTQWRDTALLQSAALIGQHGLSALCVWFAASLALWLTLANGTMTRRNSSALWATPLVALIGLHAGGAARIWMTGNSAAAEGNPIRVLLVQTNVPSLAKNRTSEAFRDTPLGQSITLTDEYCRSTSGPLDLVVWPETTLDIRRAKPNSPAFRAGPAGLEFDLAANLAKIHDVAILTGATCRTETRELFNEAELIRADGSEAHIAKTRLVPFGERAPYSEFLPLLARLAPNPPMSAGTSREPLQVTVRSRKEPVRLGTLICFESCFGEPARGLCRNGAQGLIVLTNDEWFAGTNGPWEHAMMCTMRAVENNVPVIQVSNAGHTIVVDRFGRIVLRTRFGERQAVPTSIGLK